MYSRRFLLAIVVQITTEIEGESFIGFQRSGYGASAKCFHATIRFFSILTFEWQIKREQAARNRSPVESIDKPPAIDSCGCVHNDPGSGPYDQQNSLAVWNFHHGGSRVRKPKCMLPINSGIFDAPAPVIILRVHEKPGFQPQPAGTEFSPIAR